MSGHDRGARVSTYFGPGITSYEWVYIVPPETLRSILWQARSKGPKQ